MKLVYRKPRRQLITARQRSWGNIMFSQASVNLFTGGLRVSLVPCSLQGVGYLWSHVLSSISHPMSFPVSLVPCSFWGVSSPPAYPMPPPEPQKRVVRILLECFLVWKLLLLKKKVPRQIGIAGKVSCSS